MADLNRRREKTQRKMKKTKNHDSHPEWASLEPLAGSRSGSTDSIGHQPEVQKKIAIDELPDSIWKLSNIQSVRGFYCEAAGLISWTNDIDPAECGWLAIAFAARVEAQFGRDSIPFYRDCARARISSIFQGYYVQQCREMEMLRLIEELFLCKIDTRSGLEALGSVDLARSDATHVVLRNSARGGDIAVVEEQIRPVFSEMEESDTTDRKVKKLVDYWAGYQNFDTTRKLMVHSLIKSPLHCRKWELDWLIMGEGELESFSTYNTFVIVRKSRTHYYLLGNGMCESLRSLEMLRHYAIRYACYRAVDVPVGAFYENGG